MIEHMAVSYVVHVVMLTCILDNISPIKLCPKIKGQNCFVVPMPDLIYLRFIMVDSFDQNYPINAHLAKK